MANNTGSMPRWVVAHCGARDSYQLPIAFHEVGQLNCFVTDWYSPLDSPILGTLLKYAPSSLRSILGKRYRQELPSSFVKDLKLGGALTRFSGSDKRVIELDRLVGEYAAHLASESGSQLLVTSYNGWAAFPKASSRQKKYCFRFIPIRGFCANSSLDMRASSILVTALIVKRK